MEALGGYFRTSDAMMRSLVAEMEAQGMFDENESMRDKLERQNGTITPEEITSALEHLDWPISPQEPLPGVVVTEFDKMMASIALEAEDVTVSGGTEAVMRAHPTTWAREWLEWITFLFDARKHGGVVVA